MFHPSPMKCSGRIAKQTFRTEKTVQKGFKLRPTNNIQTRFCRFLKAGFKIGFFYKCVKFENGFLKFKKPVLYTRINM